MKIIGNGSLVFLATVLASSAIAAGQDTLFPASEFGVSIFGEAAQGNIDSEPQHNVLHSTTTVSTTVAAPLAVPTPTPPINPGLKRAVLKPATVGSAKTTDPTKVYKSTRVRTTDRLEHNAGGGGIEATYYCCRYAGIALEGDFLGGNPYNTALTGNLIFRYPFEFGAQTVSSGYSKDGKEVKSGKDGKDGKTTVEGPTWGLAPYILVGGGGQWDGRGEGIGAVGGGVEFRFRQHYGIFVEGRWIIHDSRESYAAETAGFSYNF